MPYRIGSTRDLQYFTFFSFVLNFQFLTYSFAHIVPIIDKNNICKFRSYSYKIEKGAISNNGQRVISCVAVTNDGFCVGNSAASVATHVKQHILSIDFEILIIMTRLASNGYKRKDFFSV